jgi:hypothetical protein
MTAPKRCGCTPARYCQQHFDTLGEVGRAIARAQGREPEPWPAKRRRRPAKKSDGRAAP